MLSKPEQSKRELTQEEDAQGILAALETAFSATNLPEGDAQRFLSDEQLRQEIQSGHNLLKARLENLKGEDREEADELIKKVETYLGAKEK